MTAPLLTVLNFSGGRGSSALLWLVLLDLLPRPKNFLVLRADPGMENTLTYEYCNMMEKRCDIAGIDMLCVPGPDLFKDLCGIPIKQPTRFDLPPYWTKDKVTGKRGMLLQKCTAVYKIAAMDRVIRLALSELHGISVKSKNFGANVVEKWIGFDADEQLRIKPSKQKYVYFRYPLVELGIGDELLDQFYVEFNIPKPPRSVCNACFANDVAFLKDMYENRPLDWAQAVEVDNAVRDLSCMDIHDEVYVSNTLLSLVELARRGFDTTAEPEVENAWPLEMAACDSGHCFV